MVLEKSSLFITFNVKILPHSNSKYSANFRPTETYYIPNYGKFYENFAELFRFASPDTGTGRELCTRVIYSSMGP